MTFSELIKMVVEHDIDLARRERAINQAGFADSPEATRSPEATDNMERPILFPLKGRRVAGHRGMVGSALVRRLAQEECQTLTAGREWG